MKSRYLATIPPPHKEEKNVFLGLDCEVVILLILAISNDGYV